MLSHEKNSSSSTDNTNKGKSTTYNMHEVAELLGTSYGKIYHWCCTLKKELGMENTEIQYIEFTENDVNNLKLVKDLVLNKNYSTDKVKNIFKSLEISSHVKEDATPMPTKIKNFINKLQSNFNLGVFFTQNKKYHLDEIAELLNVEEFRIVYWYNCFLDKFSAPCIGIYQEFNKSDVNFFKRIKHLSIDKNYHMNEVKKLLA